MIETEKIHGLTEDKINTINDMEAEQLFEGGLHGSCERFYRRKHEKQEELARHEGGLQRLCKSLERELTIVGSRPCMGGTSLMLSMALEMAKAGIRIIYYAHPYQKIGERIARYLDMKDKQRTFPIKKDIPFYYSHLYEHENLHVMKKVIWEDMRKIGPWCIFIDSIQDIPIDDMVIKNGLSPEEFICHELREVALWLDTCMVVGAGLNLNTEERNGLDGKLPTLGDFRGGDLAYYAQKIIFPYRPEYYNIYNDERTGEDIHGCMYIYGYNLGDCEGMKLRFDHRTGRVYDPEQEQWLSDDKATSEKSDSTSPSGESDLPF